jgi:hypothetical protein
MRQLHSDAVHLKIGNVILNESSMFLIDHTLVYVGQFNDTHDNDDAITRKEKESRGSVTKLNRRIEMARLLSRK